MDALTGAVAGIVLAAGAAARFGAPKQVQPLAGRPLLEHVTAALADTRIERRLVVLGASAERVLAGVHLHGAEVVIAENWRAGQAASLRAGLTRAGDVGAVLIVLGDGPRLEPAAVNRLLEAHARRPGELLAADYGAGRSHPVVIPRSLWPRLPAVGESPARLLPATLIPCSDLTAPGDIDTPADLSGAEQP